MAKSTKLLPWQRLERIMTTMGWDEADLRRELELSPQQVWNYKNRNGTIGAELAFRIQLKTMFNPRWVMECEGPERITALSEQEQSFIDVFRKLPDEQREALLALFRAQA